MEILMDFTPDTMAVLTAQQKAKRQWHEVATICQSQEDREIIDAARNVAILLTKKALAAVREEEMALYRNRHYPFLLSTTESLVTHVEAGDS